MPLFLNSPPILSTSPYLTADQAMVDRDFAKAEKISEEFKNPEYKTYFHGCIAVARGEMMTARRFFETLRPTFEARVRDHPENAFERSESGTALCLSGPERGGHPRMLVAQSILSRRARTRSDAPLLANMLALVYARTGETDQAITLIERLLTTPARSLQSTHEITMASRSWTCVCVGSGILCGRIRASKKFSRGRNRRRFISGMLAD